MEVKPLLSAADVAALLDVKIGTVYAWTEQGRLPHVRLGRRAVRFDRDEILAWIESQRVPAEAAS